jgi:hypothetical protein
MVNARIYQSSGFYNNIYIRSVTQRTSRHSGRKAQLRSSGGKQFESTGVQMVLEGSNSGITSSVKLAKL